MRPRAGSWFPCSPQHSPEQAANRVVVSRVGADVVERTPIARHCNTRLIQLLTSYQLIRRRRPSDHRNSRGSCPSPERRGAGGEDSQQHSQHGVQSTNARPRRRPPNRLFEAFASDLRPERDSGRSHGSGSKGLEDYIERAMVRARRASMLQPNSDAVNPEARCRADRPCLGGSESRNRLSELLVWPVLFWGCGWWHASRDRSTVLTRRYVRRLCVPR